MVKSQTASNKEFAYLQLGVFLSVVLLFQYKLFTFAFILSFGLILILVFISKEERVFSWIIAAYLSGNLLFLYGDRLLDELPFQAFVLLILNRFFLIMPILLMVYVSRKFNKIPNRFLQKTDWNGRIYFPFIWRGFHSITVKKFLFAAVLINFAILGPQIFSSGNPFSSTNFYLFLIGFSAVNAFMEEVIWRGILLTGAADLAGEKASVILTGIAFGFSHLMLGYSLAACLLFAAGGIFYGAITVKSGSMFPALLWHFALNTLMILSGSIPFPGY
ncbi:CPBP family intramembrane glutamic endopeptidase [Cytobacillus sp. NCCP-133]|uniref:CPBP family intramembrane glutamic endopeptidase n=1 Tax=Cytobacillus sp. NCCP-133 TaxID=766848 RepID=UPI0022311709|nr:type II CAAX endopeptidase family protein [Cytobacillus sp. NCCP-133]